MPSASRSPEDFVAELPSELHVLVKKLRSTLRKINSNYEELCAWKGLAYKLGENYSCMIAPYKDHIKLMIWRGVDLEDPEDRLLGSGLNTRHLVLRETKDIHPSYLELLLKQQFALYASGIPWEEPCSVRKGGPIPQWIENALKKRKLTDAYEERPPYQRRDYIHWITQAKKPETQERRLQQMLSELAGGDTFMKMPWKRKGT